MQDWIKVGAQCVCINDDWAVNQYGTILDDLTRLPMLNEVLTIAEIGEPNYHPSHVGEVFLRFEEIPSPQGRVTWVKFTSGHFRPLTELGKTQEEDVAIFKPLLNTTKIEELV